MSKQKKLYELTDAHRAKLAPWRDRWIANALRCGEYTEAEKRSTKGAVNGLYRAAGLKPPKRVLFCQSPISAGVAAGVAAGVIWLRKNTGKHVELFGRKVTDAEILASIFPACAHSVRHGMASLRGEKIEAPKAPPISAATDAATSAATEAATSAATEDATGAATRDATEASTEASTEAATRDAIDAATEAATGAATRAATEDATGAATRAATRDATDAATRAATMDATRDATEAATRDATLDATLDATIVRLLVDCAARCLYMCNSGNQWSGYVAYLSFFRHVAKIEIDYSKFKHYETMSKLGPRFMHEDFCIISELPEGKIYRDAENRPHREDGPHMHWRDGWALYHWHGVRVPAAWIENKASVDPSLALTWPNIEQRRCLAEIIGWKRVLEQLKPTIIDADADPEIGTLVEVELPDAGKARFLRVMCGTKREFVLAVPPEMKSAAESNAWTFGLDAKQFAPEVRT